MKVLKNCSLTLVERKKSLLMQYVFLLIFSAISAMWLQKFNMLSLVTPSSLIFSTSDVDFVVYLNVCNINDVDPVVVD